MSIKIERINHSMIREISYILEREVKDKNIKFVTITDVKVTNDLSFAKVYYTVLDKEKKESTKQALEKAAPFIRTKLAEKVEVRHTPELRFIYDESIAYGEHIESLIKEIKEKE